MVAVVVGEKTSDPILLPCTYISYEDSLYHRRSKILVNKSVVDGDIRETLKNAKRGPFRVVSHTLQHSPPLVEI